MGTTTPNMGIYIPAAGETGYEQSVAAGFMNIDQHDHSGAPNKGVPITASGLANFSVTYQKLNANIVDSATGIGTKGAPLQNQLEILGLLKNIYQIATATGFLAKDGSNATARTIQGTANQVTVTNGDGQAGNPVISFPTTFFNSGTFTPTIETSNADIAGVVYISQNGTWQKIGKWIMYDLDMEFNATGGTGTFIINGLPEAALAGTYWSGGFLSGASLAPSATQQTCNYTTSSSSVLIFPIGTPGTPPIAANGRLEVPVGPFGFNMQFTGIYQWSA